jgi:predicted RNase H-like nuclease
MRAVLGIDAAWTPRQPSGVALVAGVPGAWRVLAVESSLDAFVGEASPREAEPTLEEVLRVSAERAGVSPEVVAIDMPLARSPVRRRRRADDEVSRRFGARRCSTHSPTPDRPGPRADAWRAALEGLGLGLATTSSPSGAAPACLEVYPHVALLELCGARERLPYKASRSARYWPGATVAERVARILEQLRRIHGALERELGPLPLELPPEARTLAGLKPFEDALDALVCAWAGARHLEADLVPLGDEDAAIWVPRGALEE